MMRQYELVERVTSYDPDADEDMLNKAYVYAMKAHGHQVRASGDPYFTHPLEVAAILTDMRLDDATIAAALLHDVVEDTEATHQEIEELFGPEISGLVEGLTKIKRLDLISKEAAQAENLRKLLLAMARDARVLLVKLADRLHNMRTLNHVKPEKRARIARETMDIYAPLAGRMGMHAIREELDDISFEALYPEAREGIIKRLETLRAESGDILANIEERLTDQFSQAGIEANVTGREKKPCSIWRKMQRKDLSLGQLSDIFGFRVIVETLQTVIARWALCIPPGAWCLAGSRITSRTRNRTTTVRSTRRSSAHTASALSCRSEQPRWTRLPSAALRRTAFTRTLPIRWRPSAESSFSTETPMLSGGCDHLLRALPRAITPASSLSTRGLSCSPTKCFASHPKAR
jgi:hypothetical protein